MKRYDSETDERGHYYNDKSQKLFYFTDKNGRMKEGKDDSFGNLIIEHVFKLIKYSGDFGNMIKTDYFVSKD